jgi:16S rRNA (cytosine1402-N4)-methyltransferase
MTSYPHISVLLKECLLAFEEVNLDTFVDGTLGAGGHSEALLTAHPEVQRFIGIDQDPSALKIASKRLEKFQGVSRFIHGNFSDLEKILKEQKIDAVDGILVDLGVSSMQLDQGERGFSFMRDGPLDMRMDPTGEISAKEIVNTWEEKPLADIFYLYGEEKQSYRAAQAIIEARQKKPFETTLELAQVIEKKLKRVRWDIHPATKIFQAIRIAVNGELTCLEAFLPQALKALRPGGRLAVITFHSLEDRIVKQRFAYFASDKESTSGIGGMFLTKIPQGKLVFRKAIEADEEEVSVNPRSRSAKLRVLEKL